tara:strand:+ start:142 stop:366 length:225 start_codon:yes stop_codon:yes gene_type:complete
LVGIKMGFKIGYVDTVHGICPHCDEETLLVAVVTDFYKCSMCGEETKQYVNGSIKYLKLNDRDREWLKENQSSE